MTATSILPDPHATNIKLGRGPRRNYSWCCGWAAWPSTQKAKDYKGTPATDRKIRHAAALARVLFMTKSEATALASAHRRSLTKSVAEYTQRETWSDKYKADWWSRAKAEAHIQVPAWLHRDLDRVHGVAFLKPRVAAAAIYYFADRDNDEIVRWCEYVEQQTEERRAVDDEAFAALSGIIRDEQNINCRKTSPEATI